MEAADECVDFPDSADLLRMFERVDDAGMAAGADHDQAAIAEPEACCMLVPVLVGLGLPG